MDTMASEGCNHTHSGVTGYANIVADGPAKSTGSTPGTTRQPVITHKNHHLL